jgi:hypothetical protein
MSLEISYKKKLYTRNTYDSPLNGFNSLNVNTRRYYATLSDSKRTIDKLQIDPWFITGFTDGEGCFSCSVLKSSSYKFGWEVQLNFQIKLHVKDYPLLLAIQHSLGGIGTVSSNQSICAFRVRKFQEVVEVVKFFDKYPLISRKRGDYLLFKQIVSIMELKEHLTLEGLQKIINTKATLNFGLSKELQLMFPETIPVPRLLIETRKIPHPQWIAGFTSAEGNFSVSLDKGVFKSLLFKITQHKIDEVLLTAIKEYFNCGYCYLRKQENIIDFKTTKFSEINEIIIPFFIDNPILGVKSLDFNDWCLVSEIVKKREDKLEGAIKIREIQSGMNRGRSK